MARAHVRILEELDGLRAGAASGRNVNTGGTATFVRAQFAEGFRCLAIAVRARL